MATEKLSPGILPTKAKPKRVALYCTCNPALAGLVSGFPCPSVSHCFPI